jgi:hypothetical protein
MSLLTEEGDMIGLKIKDIGDMPIYFSKKCYEATKKNLKLALEKLSRPEDMMNIKTSGALQDAAKNGLGALGSFAGNYLARNADKVALGVLSATSPSFQNSVKDTLNNVYKWTALAFQANNNIVFIMMKIVARNCVKQLELKDIRLNNLKQKLTALYNAILMFAAGDPILNQYLQELRSAMSEVLLARNKVRLTRNTMSRSNIFLTKAWKEAQTHAYNAQLKIRPSTGNNPYVQPFLSQAQGGQPAGSEIYLSGARIIQGETAGFIPTTKEQTDNLLAIPKLTREIIIDMKDYAVITASINGMLSLFIAGVDKIASAMFDQVKISLLEQMKIIDDDLTKLYEEMVRYVTPKDRSTPSPVRVTAQAFKWTVSLHFINSSMALLPTKSLQAAGRSLNDVAVYKNSVDALKRMDTLRSGKAVLVATDAQEDVGSFERQMLTAMLQANLAVIKHEAAQKAAPLIKTLVSRVDLGIARNAAIKGTLNSYIAYRFEGEEAMDQILNAVDSTLKKFGLDKALDHWRNGEFEKFFTLDPKTATYVGAGLAALAALKKCFSGSVEEQEKFTPYQRELEREQDLLNVKISFDLDFAMLKNLDVCLRAGGLIKMFNFDELFCKLVTSAYDSIFDSLGDSVEISDTSSTQQSTSMMTSNIA